ncbi:ABC transporter ATP-binding protein [Mycoplasma flocculare]|uniref:ATP-binding cassette domain-containing protein n=1 Tax=Mesomycoplasma flocculare TaxID=2128 RepID=UPI00136F8257|nr:ABC transporter ATP-binding protein [Mesomycoplasma flocculare]MXR56333.1 ABC transporter ATP-binding protein [Mesomycoplasma flocculare]
MNGQKIAITIKNLLFSYDKKNFLKIDNLEIPANKIITILGPSGAGKSTFLNLLTNFLPAKSAIRYNPEFKNFGYIMQKNNLYEEISVRKNLWLSTKNSEKWNEKVWSLSLEQFNFVKQKANYVKNIKNFFKTDGKTFWQKIYQKFNFYTFIIKNLKFYLFYIKFRKTLFEREMRKILKSLEIENIFHKKVSNISGGQQQRVAFAKSIIKGDNLIFMDEPFSSLDAKIKEATIKLLLKIKKEFMMTIILVTHDQNDALKISDKIALLNKGKIMQFSEPEELFENPNSLFVAKFIGFPEINFLEKKGKNNFYIRSKYIKIVESKNKANGKILYKKNLADNFYYQIHDIEKNIDLEIVTPVNIVDQKVKIEYDKNKIFAFDERGNRVKC